TSHYFFSSRRRHTIFSRDWSSDVCSSDLYSDPELTYYKPLIKINELTFEDCENKLELWNLEPYQIKEQKAKWKWNINDNNKPIRSEERRVGKECKSRCSSCN